MANRPINDVILVIPGIMGSVLELDGRTVWGPGAVLSNLVSLGSQVQRLKLPPDILDNEPNDGVRATAATVFYYDWIDQFGSASRV